MRRKPVIEQDLTFNTFCVEPHDMHLSVYLPTRGLAEKAYENLQKFLSAGWKRAKAPRGYVSYPNCICWLLRKKWGCKNEYRLSDPCIIPYRDHPRAFRNPTTGERCIIHQPYIFNSPCIPSTDTALIERVKAREQKELAELIRDSEEFAAKHGLTVRVSPDDTFYYPTRTVLVEYRKKSAEVSQ